MNKIRRFCVLLTLLLAACQAKPTPGIPPTPSLTTTASLTASPVPSATATLIPSLTPEPEWYKPIDPSLGTLKFQYAEVTKPKARIYSSLEDAAAHNGNFGRLPNYPAFVAYSTSRTGEDGHTYYLANYGWIVAEDLSMLNPAPFSGLLLTREVTFRFGWVLADTQSVSSAGEPGRTYVRYQVIHEVAAEPKPGFIAVGPDEWLPETAVTLTSAGLPPDAEKGKCRFIYADLKTQVLSVFDGCKLVFATLVSSGKNSWTFEGSFNILNKWDYLTINSPDWSASDYYMEGIPYFMSYAGDFGFHGNYWSSTFGIAASHGCINLSPADARWLYDWAGLGDRVIISAGE
jgi:lipoprotein-anchoring transpeptidase ErfK/SrfK